MLNAPWGIGVAGWGTLRLLHLGQRCLCYCSMFSIALDQCLYAAGELTRTLVRNRASPCSMSVPFPNTWGRPLVSRVLLGFFSLLIVSICNRVRYQSGGGGQYGRKTHLGRSRAMTARRKSPQGVLQASARAMAANRSARRRTDDPVTCRGPRGGCLPSPIPPSLLLTCCLLRPPAFGHHSSFHAHSLCPSYPAPYLHPLPPARVRDLLS